MLRTETPAIPPRIAPAPRLMTLVAVVCGIGLLAGCVVLYLFNPSRYGFYPVCEFHELTGLNCPGCGGTRAAYELLHGHWLKSLHENALLLLSIGVMAGRGAWIALQKWHQRPVSMLVPPALLWAFLVLAVVFTALRNLPAFSFLAP